MRKEEVMWEVWGKVYEVVTQGTGRGDGPDSGTARLQEGPRLRFAILSLKGARSI